MIHISDGARYQKEAIFFSRGELQCRAVDVLGIVPPHGRDGARAGQAEHLEFCSLGSQLIAELPQHRLAVGDQLLDAGTYRLLESVRLQFAPEENAHQKERGAELVASRERLGAVDAFIDLVERAFDDSLLVDIDKRVESEMRELPFL